MNKSMTEYKGEQIIITAKNLKPPITCVGKDHISAMTRLKKHG